MNTALSKTYTWDEYRSIERMNASTLVHGCDSMLALQHAIDSKFQATASMRFGNEMHALLLEPHEFMQRHRVMPNFAKDPYNIDGKDIPSNSPNTSWCRNKKRIFRNQSQEEGFAVIGQEDYDRALAMCTAIRRKPSACLWYDNCDREVTLLGKIAGLKFKGRVDLLGHALVDVKGTVSVKPSLFGSVFAKLRYDFRMAIYRELARQNGKTPNAVYIIAVENTAPHDVVVFQVADEILDVAMEQVVRLIKDYKLSVATNSWPGVDGGEDYVDLVLPAWKTATEDKVDWGA